MRTTFAILLCLLATISFAADYPLIIIDLQHRLPEEVLPALQPLAGPDGVVTGANASLFVRASPARLADIRAALAHIDRPARNLMVEVRRASTGAQARAGIGMSVDERLGSKEGSDGRIRIGPGRGTGIRAGASRQQGSRELLQQVRVLDGGQAFISIGTERPVGYRNTYMDRSGPRVREGIGYASAETAFYARPSVNGDRVTVVLSTRSARFGHADRVDTGALDTRIRGRLGEWIPIGQNELAASEQGAGVLALGEKDVIRQSGLELRVRAMD